MNPYTRRTLDHGWRSGGIEVSWKNVIQGGWLGGLRFGLIGNWRGHHRNNVECLKGARVEVASPMYEMLAFHLALFIHARNTSVKASSKAIEFKDDVGEGDKDSPAISTGCSVELGSWARLPASQQVAIGG
jgi:hypothetical protein